MQRPSSTVIRMQEQGRTLYAKRYIERPDEGVTDEINRARAAREAELLLRLDKSDLFGGDLGVLKLVSSDASAASLVTEEVPGNNLQDYLWESVYNGDQSSFLRGLNAAGRWLRQFQSLPIRPEDRTRFGDREPYDLIENCTIRLETIKDCGYPWPTTAVRERLVARLAELIDSAEEGDRGFVWSHCDYGPWNILWDGRRLTPLDFYACRTDFPLVDVTYFIHRLEMQSVYFPWRRLPVKDWKQAFLKGYGRPDADRSPMYHALMIRQHVCRLLTYVRRPMINLKQQIHNRWVRRAVRARLNRLITDG